MKLIKSTGGDTDCDVMEFGMFVHAKKLCCDRRADTKRCHLVANKLWAP